MPEETALRPRENYTSHIMLAFGLTLTILFTFQFYIWREPARIRGDEERARAAAIEAGQALFAENCVACHGDKGEGATGPALNSKGLLAMVSDESLFSLTGTGVPGTQMPAWGQAFGGPFTNEQITQIVAYMRAWESSAPVIESALEQPDPVQGANIYAQTCFICHGENGEGTERAPALNDPARLGKLDDAWYRNTIARGRPAKGMPTWGTVLSPAQLNHLVALIGFWREGKAVLPDIPLSTLVTNALFALREFDRPDALFYLNAALTIVDGQKAAEIQAIVVLIEENHLFEAQTLLTSFLPPAEMGRALFDTNCAPCHGIDGAGDMGPNLHTSAFIEGKTDRELIEFILAGRNGTSMDGFEGILGEEEILNVIALMREWQ